MSLNFTSIKNLRASSAMQTRVTQVANNLKKLNANWQPEWFFPVAAVGLSNGVEDVSWVSGKESVLLDDDVACFIDGVTFSGDELASLGRDLNYCDSKEDAQTKVNKFDEELTTFAGRPLSWKMGMTEVGKEKAKEKAPTVDTAASSTATSRSDDEIDEDKAFIELSKLSNEDVLAVVMKVAVARGGLFNGDLYAPESVAFLQVLDPKGNRTYAEATDKETLSDKIDIIAAL